MYMYIYPYQYTNMNIYTYIHIHTYLHVNRVPEIVHYYRCLCAHCTLRNSRKHVPARLKIVEKILVPENQLN